MTNTVVEVKIRVGRGDRDINSMQSDYFILRNAPANVITCRRVQPPALDLACGELDGQADRLLEQDVGGFAS